MLCILVYLYYYVKYFDTLNDLSYLLYHHTDFHFDKRIITLVSIMKNYEIVLTLLRFKPLTSEVVIQLANH
jgi:hypothetical protein